MQTQADVALIETLNPTHLVCLSLARAHYQQQLLQDPSESRE
jgi:hypothetical protein